MIKKIQLPTNVEVVPKGNNRAIFLIDGCYPGYGQTLANALRRVLLSSLTGSAITSVKIEGVNHEFSTIPGVLEDVIQVILNLKKVRFRLLDDGPYSLKLSHSKVGPVKASVIECPSEVEVVTPDALIATITTPGSRLEMELTVERGMGFEPHESRQKGKLSIGTIALDAIYTPVRRVAYSVEDMRIGERTDFNRIHLDIETDGSITPEEGFVQASNILKDHFAFLHNALKTEKISAKPRTKQAPVKKPARAADKPKKSATGKPKTLSELGIPDRIITLVEKAGIKSPAGLASRKKESLLNIPNLGEKSVNLIEERLKKFGLSFK